jgi:uncharacterized protein
VKGGFSASAGEPGGGSCLIVFLKEPRPGLVKTRLARDVGPRRAVLLYRAFVRDQLEWLSAFPCEGRRLCFAPAEGRRACIDLIPRGRKKCFRAIAQSPGDLGRRLRAAFRAAFRDGFQAVIAVGTDTPLLSPRILAKALDSLRRKDLVLGPSRDGGYYLIGLRRPAPRLFSGIPWSSADVLDRTLLRAREEGLQFALCSVLGDVDTSADLPILQRDLDRARKSGGYLPARTARALSACWKAPRGREGTRRRDGSRRG